MAIISLPTVGMGSIFCLNESMMKLLATENLPHHVFIKTQVTHFSFWLHWFPTCLLLLNLDTWLRKAHTIFLLGRLKQMLGKLLILFIAVRLCLSYWISAKASLHVDWQSLGGFQIFLR